MNTNWLANFLNRQREVIEAAETPFSKLAIFILPILAPSVPATLTGLHLYKLLIEVFTFSGSDVVARIFSVIASIVLELLGYVGAISFIQSLYQWIKTRADEYLVPAILNGFSYVIYLVFMYAINVLLGRYFGTPPIMNNIIGILSFITVPTGLLAANHLSQRQEREYEKELRSEQREERMEKYRIKHGVGNFPNQKETFQKDVESFQTPIPKVSESFPKNWRKLRPTLSAQDVENLANITPIEIKEIASKYGVEERTVINWRIYARKELGL